MAISNPIVLNYDSGTKSLTKISQDGSESRYLLRESTQEFSMVIRHSVESPQKNGTKFERHHVTLTRTVFAEDTSTADDVTQLSFVIRNRKAETAASVALLGDALADFLSNAHFLDLVAWVN